MSDPSFRSHSTHTLNGDHEALAQLRGAVVSGAHWYLAVLDAIALWESAEEVYQGVRYQYVLAGEAFDWLRLAERLASEIADFVPAKELEALLFTGTPPLLVDQQEFRRRIGPAKHRAHLNFFYGVVVEEALLSTAEDDLAKEQQCAPMGARRCSEDAYLRVYGLRVEELLQRYRRQYGRPAAENITLDELLRLAQG